MNPISTINVAARIRLPLRDSRQEPTDPSPLRPFLGYCPPNVSFLSALLCMWNCLRSPKVRYGKSDWFINWDPPYQFGPPARNHQTHPTPHSGVMVPKLAISQYIFINFWTDLKVHLTSQWIFCPQKCVVRNQHSGLVALGLEHFGTWSIVCDCRFLREKLVKHWIFKFT